LSPLASVPTGVVVSRSDVGRSATLSWAPPASGGASAVTGYRVARNGTDASGGGAWSATVPATVRSQVFSKLVPGQTYTLTVQAINASGTGPSASVKVTLTAQ
jgi:hypothetical protein